MLAFSFADPPPSLGRATDNAWSIRLVRAHDARHGRCAQVLSGVHRVGNAAVRQGLCDVDEWRDAIRRVVPSRSGHAAAGRAAELDAVHREQQCGRDGAARYVARWQGGARARRHSQHRAIRRRARPAGRDIWYLQIDASIAIVGWNALAGPLLVARADDDGSPESLRVL